MSRDLTNETQDALQEPSVRPVLIGRLDILSDPVYAWTGPGLFVPTGSGDSALDGNSYDPAEAFLDLSAINEDQDIGGPVTITAKAHLSNEPLLRQLVRDRREWRARPAYLWLGLLDENEQAVIPYPTRIKTGVMTSMLINRDAENASVDITIDSDLGNSRSAAFRWLDHSRFHPGDNWSSYILRLANRPTGFERPPNPRGSSTGVSISGFNDVRIRRP